MISYRLFIVNSIFVFFTVSILLRIVQKNIVSVLDFGILFLTLFVGFLLNKLIVFNNMIIKQSIYYLIFLIYIVLNIVFFSFYRVFELKIDFFDVFLANIFEFKIFIISLFLFMIFFILKDIDKDKFERFIILLLKIGLVYTFIEQILSLFGGRNFFETIYSFAGIVSENLIDLKSLGFFRVWGVIGSTQLLGIYHLILLSYYLFGKRTNNFWLIMSIIGIILSTSKTAYAILIFMLLVYFVVKRRYLILSIVIIPLLFGIVYFLTSLDENFVESFVNYFYIMTGELKFNNELSDYEKLIINLNQYTYLFGQGLNYSYSGIEDIPLELKKFYYISADYSFMSLINQFGLVGYILFSVVFLIYPTSNFINNYNREHNINLIILWLGTFHYSVFISKLIMLYISYSIFVVYFNYKEKKVEKFNNNNSCL